MTETHPSARTLLAGLFDYAGLFPPAGLGMAETVANFADYRGGPDAWMLGRLIVPWARRDEFLDALGGLDDETTTAWPVSLLVPAPTTATTAAELRTQHAAFAARSSRRVRVGAVETKVADEAALAGLASIVDLYTELFPDAEIHVEAAGPIDPVRVLDAVAEQRDRTGRGAGKLRTGSVTSDGIPSVEEVVAYIRAAAARDIPWKATAGLHHTLPATRPLTYEPDAPHGPMFGYLGVVVAAGRAVADPGVAPEELRALLLDPEPPTLDDLSVATMQAARTRGCLSIGTCSVTEPVEGARDLGLLEPTPAPPTPAPPTRAPPPHDRPHPRPTR